MVKVRLVNQSGFGLVLELEKEKEEEKLHRLE